jgi:hypothetical protein
MCRRRARRCGPGCIARHHDYPAACSLAHHVARVCGCHSSGSSVANCGSPGPRVPVVGGPVGGPCGGHRSRWCSHLAKAFVAGVFTRCGLVRTSLMRASPWKYPLLSGRIAYRTGALPSGQETLPFEEWNLPSPRLRNHHLNMNHRTEPHAADKTSLKRITKVVTKAASIHAKWWGDYRQKD